MYDNNSNFRYLSKKHIKPGIKTRSNSKVRATNCQAMNMSVINVVARKFQNMDKELILKTSLHNMFATMMYRDNVLRNGIIYATELLTLYFPLVLKFVEMVTKALATVKYV